MIVFIIIIIVIIIIVIIVIIIIIIIIIIIVVVVVVFAVAVVVVVVVVVVVTVTVTVTVIVIVIVIVIIIISLSLSACGCIIPSSILPCRIKYITAYSLTMKRHFHTQFCFKFRSLLDICNTIVYLNTFICPAKCVWYISIFYYEYPGIRTNNRTMWCKNVGT